MKGKTVKVFKKTEWGVHENSENIVLVPKATRRHRAKGGN